MSILVIDMMTSRTRLACGDDYIEYPETRDQAELLPHHIESIIKQADCTYQNLRGIVAITGPGSFTGLRVALSSAHALGLSLNIPVVGVSADEAFALTLGTDKDVALILDTRRKDFAVALKKKNEANFSAFQEFDEDGITNIINGHFICGNGAIKAGLAVDQQDIDLVKLAQNINIHDGEYNPNTAQPLYLRPPDVTMSSQKFEHQKASSID